MSDTPNSSRRRWLVVGALFGGVVGAASYTVLVADPLLAGTLAVVYAAAPPVLAHWSATTVPEPERSFDPWQMGAILLLVTGMAGVSSTLELSVGAGIALKLLVGGVGLVAFGMGISAGTDGSTT